VRYKLVTSTRVSIMPTIHGEDAVIRILDRNRSTNRFATSIWMWSALPKKTEKVSAYIAEPVRHGAGHGTDRLG